MKTCPRCSKTYHDDDLNFCLDDGATLAQTADAGGSVPATMIYKQPQITGSNQYAGDQNSVRNDWNNTGSQTGNQNNPNRFAMQPPKKSRGWLWAVGILGGLVLLCGGGFTGFVFWAASLEDKQNNNYSGNTATSGNTTTKSPVYQGASQTIDLSKWAKGDTDIGVTEFENGEFVMSSKNKGYYYVLASSLDYKTENAVTKVTVRNLDEESSAFGFGLIIHSNPMPLKQDYAFLIDSESKKYRIVSHTPGDETVVVGWTRAAVIKDGSESNVLEVRDENKKMNFYINGEFIKVITNEVGYSGGVTGLYSGDAVRVAFSNLEIRK